MNRKDNPASRPRSDENCFPILKRYGVLNKQGTSVQNKINELCVFFIYQQTRFRDISQRPLQKFYIQDGQTLYRAYRGKA